MYKLKNILLVEENLSIARIFEKLARGMGWSYARAENGEDALKMMAESVFETIIINFGLPGFTGLQLLEHMKANDIGTEIIMLRNDGSSDLAASAIKHGAYDYIGKPFDDIDRIRLILEKAMDRFRLVQRIKSLERRDMEGDSFNGIIGKSKKMQDIFSLIENIATTDSAVLIQGESGTGKELVAKAIHATSMRKNMPYVVINCAAIPQNLLETELFGHIKGSFTDAVENKKGLFEEADGGTIFLDEIGDISLSVQVKFLRVLQDGEMQAVGAVESKRVNVRIIAATNRNLSVAVREGSFREDLFYRINVIGIHLPPLRERQQDIPLLAYHFLDSFMNKQNKRLRGISVDALKVLQSYSWPGNVRELENIMERAVVLSKGEYIEIKDFPPKILGDSFYLADNMSSSDGMSLPYSDAKKRALVAFNVKYISGLLKKTSGNITFSAEMAGMDRSNFKKLIKKYGIIAEDYRK